MRVTDAGYLVGGQLVASACAFALTVALARALGPTGKGYVDLVVSSVGLLATFTGFSLTSGVFYHVAKGSVDHRRLAVGAVILAVAQGLVVGALLLALRDSRVVSWLLPPDDRAMPVILIGALLAAVQAQRLTQAVLKGLGRFGAFATSEVVATGGALVVALVLILAGPRVPQFFVLGLVGATVASTVVVLRANWAVPVVSRGVPVAAIFAYSLPLFLGNAVQFLNYRLDIFFLKNYLGLRAVGEYTVAVALSQLLWLVPNQVASIVMRDAAAGTTESSAQRLALVHRMTVYLTIGLGLLLVLAGYTALTPIFGSAFRGSVVPLVLLTPGVVAFSSTIILSAHLNGIGKQAYTTWVACAALVVTVALNVAIVPVLGVAGAAIASTASYGTSLVLTALLTLRHSGGLAPRDLFFPRRSDLDAGVSAARRILASIRGPWVQR